MKWIAWIAALSALLLMPAGCNKPAPPQPKPVAKPAPPTAKPAPAHSATKAPPADMDVPKPDPAAPRDLPAPKKPKATASKAAEDSPFDAPGQDAERPAAKAAPAAKTAPAAKPKGVLDAMGKALLKGITGEEKPSPR